MRVFHSAFVSIRIVAYNSIMPTPIRVIVYYRNIGKYALNALAGALERDCSEHSLEFVKNQQQLIHALNNPTATRYTVVLWTFYSAQFKQDALALELIRSQTDNKGSILHVAGGVHCSAMPESALRAGFDYVACGEGEELIVQLLAALKQGDRRPRIRGLSYLDNDGQMVNQGRAQITNLDDYPPGSVRYRKFGPIEITRGCVYACKFCQTPYVNKARFRHREASHCVEFACRMYDHGLRDFRFISPTSLSYGSQDTRVNLVAIDDLLYGLRRRLGHDAKIYFGSFPSEVRPEHISADILKVLKQYVDNDNLIIGAQSGSNSVLDISRRGHDVDAVKVAADLCLQYGFKPHIDFLFGLPGETEFDRQLSLDFAEQLADIGAKIHLHSFMPLPGTPFAEKTPGRLEQSSLDRLNKLCSSGKAYGQWQKQARRSKESV